MPFCSNCGAPLQVAAAAAAVPVPMAQPAAQQPRKEKVYFKGEGELIVKKTEHHGLVRKGGALLFAAPTLGLSYLAFGRDKTRKSKAEGTLVVTDRAIYCAGNGYPFDRILSITKQGTISKSISLTFEKNVEAGGRADGGIAGVGGLSVEMELKTNDIDGLFRGLEQARMSNVDFS